jgi:hypothetical protein
MDGWMDRGNLYCNIHGCCSDRWLMGMKAAMLSKSGGESTTRPLTSHVYCIKVNNSLSKSMSSGTESSR